MSSLNPSGKGSITILVLGDAGVGKTSLISSLVSESWSERLPPVLQPVMVPSTLLPEQIQLTIIDTSSEPAHMADWLMHLRPPANGGTANAAVPASSKASLLADVVLLVVAADVSDSFARVESHWLPLLEEHSARTHTPRRPVIIAINKSAPDGSDDAPGGGGDGGGGGGLANSLSASSLDASFSGVGGVRGGGGAASFEHLVHSHRVSCILPCSAKYLNNLPRLFHACNTVVLAPIEPLFELHSAAHPLLGGCMRFKLLTQKALLRIFRLFDADADGALSFTELDRLHRVNFKGKRLAAAAFDQLMARLAATDRDFVRPVGHHSGNSGSSAQPSSSSALYNTPVGLSFSGLLHFHALFLAKNKHAWHTWTLVQAFGYQLGQVNQHAAASLAGSSTGSGGGGAGTAGSALPLARGNSQAATASGAASSSAVSTTAAALASSSPAAMPSLGSLVLSEHYCRLTEGASSFSPALAYELSPIAVDFLTSLFRKYTSAPDGLLAIRPPSPSAAAAAASSSGSSSSSTHVLVDASPSSTCSLSAHSDLERMLLSSPDQPFGAAFARFVVRSSTGGENAAAAAGAGSSGTRALQQQHVIGLEGWLSAWALLLYNYSTVPLPVLATPAAAAATATAAAPASTTGTGTNLSASFTSLSSLAAAPSSSSAAATSGGSAPFVPNPDIVLRYLTYLCFPVAPAVPEWTEQPVHPGAVAGSLTTRVYLPRIQRCIHVTPRQRDGAVEQAQAVNEHILSTDPSMSSSAIRAAVADPAAQRPRTVVCFVLGSAGCGRSAFIDCMLNNAPSSSSSGSSLSQAVSAAAVAMAAGLGAAEHQHLAAAEVSPTTPSASHARTFAARLPLQHIPAANGLSAAASAFDAGLSDVPSRSSSSSAPSNHFLLLKDIPSSLGGALLSSPSFTASSADLVLVLYDGSSAASLSYAAARVQQCFERRLPVMVIQTKADLATCISANPRADWMQCDYAVRVESFSARLFWSSVAQARATPPSVPPPPMPPQVHLFDRIFHAARQPHAYILTSLSAARRAQKRSRMLLSSLALAAGGVGLWALFRSGTLQGLIGKPALVGEATAAKAAAAAPLSSHAASALTRSA